MSELLKIIDGQVDVAQKEEWKIIDDATADWWIERKQEEIKDMDRLKKGIEGNIEFYKEQLSKVQEKEQHITGDRDAKLIEYFESLPDESKKKTKTLIKYQLPTGTLQKKFKSPTYIKNDDELLKYAEINAPEYIETQKKLKWGEFKKQTKVLNGQVVDANTGEVLPIRLEEQAPVFEVKL